MSLVIKINFRVKIRDINWKNFTYSFANSVIVKDSFRIIMKGLLLILYYLEAVVIAIIIKFQELLIMVIISFFIKLLY